MIKYVFDEDKVLNIKGADKAKAQEIGEALAKISEQEKGRLNPKAIVDAARSNRHVLHKHFEWDDGLAAEQYRLVQARDIVASIHIEHEETENGVARAFLSIRDKDGVSYRTLDEVIGSADLQSKVLASAERDLLAFESRYRSLNDICELVRGVRQQVAIRRSKHENRARA